ncbi:MAG: hypothetical protein K9L98_00200 [Candidatus Pacebacteria bacterium]|nr:hypothetical protein [Candidatus Paceibacterota bacterium]MCF7862425.1 hypothetical protein [Candidatus Paceibacterota bacterium]
MNSETRNCQNCKKDFIIEPDDFSFYEKIKVPAPTFCPECRMIRRMAFRDHRVLYKRKSDITNKIIFSIFHPKAQVKVWEQDIWWSDKLDGLDYGIDINLNESFLSQIKKLFHTVPLPSQTGWDMIDSDYSAGSSDLKNCYLVFVTTSAENCSYSAELNIVKNSMDVTRIDSSELCYQSFALTKCYRSFFSSHCENSMDIWFSRDLVGCSFCFGCTNLRSKKYCIYNKQYSKEEYEKLISSFNLGSNKTISEIKENTKDFIKKSIRKFYDGRSNVDISGEYINNSKNTFSSYYVNQVEDSKYIQLFFTPKAKDCYDCSLWGANTELSYECSSIGSNCYDIKFCCRSYKGAQNCEYSLYCIGCSHIFGCSGLKNKQYCILNKQYKKEQYEELVPQIIKHMNDMPYVDSKGRIYKYGEFFPLEFSAFPYNDSIAQEYFPLNKEEAIKQGYIWFEKENRNYQIDINTENIPDDIKDVDDSIIGKVIECDHHNKENHQKLSCDNSCTEAFKIIPEELQFYKRMNLPIPRLCPNCRHYERLAQRNPMKLWHRKCMKEGCINEFETSYAPERQEIVYCEKCYQQEVY